jgi:hypothetical protein
MLQKILGVCGVAYLLQLKPKGVPAISIEAFQDLGLSATP